MEYPTLSQGARLTAVRLKDSDGNTIGKVVEWMMDVEQGKVVYVVAEFGSGDVYHAIPWAFMKADTQHGGYIVDRVAIEQRNVLVSRDALSNLVNDKNFLQRLIDAYGLTDDASAPRAERQPAGPAVERPSGAQSNAVMGEGKGYGG